MIVTSKFNSIFLNSSNECLLKFIPVSKIFSNKILKFLSKNIYF